MKNWISILAAGLAVSFAATSAMAAGHEVSGKIERINAKQHRLTVNHRSYAYDAKTENSALEVGDAVRFSWKKEHHHRMIERFLPVAA